MHFKVLSVILLTAVILSPAAPQERTVGLMVNKAGSFSGYTLFAPMSYTTTYLINNDGLLVHSWESEHNPGMSVYLGRDGYLYRSIHVPDTTGFNTGSGGGVEKQDWNGTVVWHYEYSGDEYKAHHDIGVLPNGHVLMIAAENKDSTELVAAGRNPFNISPDGLWLDYIIEVEPVGADSGTIVWEWHTWDHLVQDYDSTKENYGIVAEHPELINLSYGEFSPGYNFNFNHFNAVSYNEEFDQCMITSRSFSEIWVIDHSTTTEEARTHTGGRFGKGGDLLYRWGNPETYDYGQGLTQKLFGPHDGNWIVPGLPGAGHILLFNNGVSRGYSSVDEIIPPVDGAGNYTAGLPYGPEGTVWSYGKSSEDFFSLMFSSAQRLPNGTTLICDGPNGIFFEVAAQGDEVWRYINPVKEDGPAYQGDSIVNNGVFKIRRYAPEYPGFEGRDLTPGGPIEKYHTAVREHATAQPMDLELSSAFFRNTVTVSFELVAPAPVRLTVATISGQVTRTLVDGSKSAGRHTIAWDGTDTAGRRSNAGIYFFILETGGGSRTTKVVKFK